MAFSHQLQQRFQRLPRRLAGAATLCAVTVACSSYTQDEARQNAASKSVGLGYAFRVPEVVSTTFKQPFRLDRGLLDGWGRARNRLELDYEMECVIGEGGFGLVHRGRHKASNTCVAMKRMPKQGTSNERFWHEVELLRQVGGHHNVVTFRDAFETTDAYVLVTEFVQGDELYHELMEHGVFHEQRAKALIRQLAETLVYLHAHDVVHADVKPENILLAQDTQPANVRLIDFGQSFHLQDERRQTIHACTTAYASPELLTHRACGAAMDVWSLGVVLYIILCGLHPFDPSDDASDDAIRHRILEGDYDQASMGWKCMSESARDLVRQMLVVDPAKRISAAQVLEHEWITSA
ncbi:hypothetical protein PsorP6_003250 [Peronosclerospora sorghi]|uniref:Uncharacterized protein n=1 Tax=Peronosclerospora sorghi TaxID=230839 RepID=A0ACC0VP30_9STRA|nr:hypothetical protein PsorP6_003250 [Peronosclerospora sorghi]